MSRHRTFQLIALVLTSLSACAQEPVAWRDPSGHKIHFITVEEDVKLEVLEWPGSGRPVVLLTGSGNTAHVYDDFAPKLAGCCHIYAVTRRGFGFSSHPESGYTDQRLADDVWKVIETLKVPSPVLVGHSMAGAELTTLGSQHSDRLSGLVYLDAGADPADFPWSNPAFRALVQKQRRRPGPPPRSEADNKSAEAFQAWQKRAHGVIFPESELRNIYDFNPDGSVGPYRTPQGVRNAIDAGAKKRDYSAIRVPVLSIFATQLPPAEQFKLEPPDDDDERATIEQIYQMEMGYIHRYMESIRHAVPSARVLEWPGANHYVYMSNETEVLRELLDFVKRLR